MIISVSLPAKPVITLPLPLFLVDEFIDAFWLFLPLVPRFVARVAGQNSELRSMLQQTIEVIYSSWNSLRWRGAFTLFEWNLDDTHVCVRFI